MIENARQYEVAKAQAAQLEAGLERLSVHPPNTAQADPVLLDTAHAGVQHVLAQLRAEIAEYESRTDRAGRAPSPAVPPPR